MLSSGVKYEGGMRETRAGGAALFALLGYQRRSPQNDRRGMSVPLSDLIGHSMSREIARLSSPLRARSWPDTTKARPANLAESRKLATFVISVLEMQVKGVVHTYAGTSTLRISKEYKTIFRVTRVSCLRVLEDKRGSANENSIRSRFSRQKAWREESFLPILTRMDTLEYNQ